MNFWVGEAPRQRIIPELDRQMKPPDSAAASRNHRAAASELVGGVTPQTHVEYPGRAAHGLAQFQPDGAVGLGMIGQRQVIHRQDQGARGTGKRRPGIAVAGFGIQCIQIGFQCNHDVAARQQKRAGGFVLRRDRSDRGQAIGAVPPSPGARRTCIRATPAAPRHRREILVSQAKIRIEVLIKANLQGVSGFDAKRLAGIGRATLFRGSDKRSPGGGTPDPIA